MKIGTQETTILSPVLYERRTWPLGFREGKSQMFENKIHKKIFTSTKREVKVGNSEYEMMRNVMILSPILISKYCYNSEI